MENVVHTEDYKGRTIKIIPDEDSTSPRDWDNLGIMACYHRNYELGDEHGTIGYHDKGGEWHELDTKDFHSWKEFEEALRVKVGAVCIAPLYLYDHSGLRMKIGSFAGLLPQGHAQFDTMQVGFIYTTREKIRECYGVKKAYAKHLEKAQECLAGEVETYDQYLSGDVYGYVVASEEDENEDSCWGYYGVEEAIEAAKSAIDYSVERERKEHEQKLKGQIRGGAPLDKREPLVA